MSGQWFSPVPITRIRPLSAFFSKSDTMPRVAAIDDARTDDRGPQIRCRRLQHELLVRRPANRAAVPDWAEPSRPSAAHSILEPRSPMCRRTRTPRSRWQMPPQPPSTCRWPFDRLLRASRVESAAVWTYASKPSAAARYDFTVFRSPSTGVTPRDASASAACGVRTSAVIW